MRIDIHVFSIMVLFACIIVCRSVRAQDDDMRLMFPLACTYGHDCWPVNYVDMDPQAGAAKDFACTSKTYDGSKGIDFALSSVRQMRAGVDVLAVAEGRVRKIRDGADDQPKDEAALQKILDNKKECGNGIIIDHGGGYVSVYCHLLQNSILVKDGQSVRIGEPIAQVGQSGLAEFPKLYFSLMKNGKVLEPHTGLDHMAGCDAPGKHSLWLTGLPMAYEPLAIFDGGFAPDNPNFKSIENGQPVPEMLVLQSRALAFWAGFYNLDQGDRIILKITAPDGSTYALRNITVENPRKRQFYYVGRKTDIVPLIPGIYTGSAHVQRGPDGTGAIIKQRIFDIRVE